MLVATSDPPIPVDTDFPRSELESHGVSEAMMNNTPIAKHAATAMFVVMRCNASSSWRKRWGVRIVSSFIVCR